MGKTIPIRLLNGSANFQTRPTSTFAPEQIAFPVLSFFTGGGFLDLGLQQAGFPIVWSLEKEPQFCHAHDSGMQSLFRAKRPGTKPPVISCPGEDIRKKGPSEIRRQAFGVRSKGDDRFGMVGGPPCPDFSVGGKNKGFAGNRGQLTQVFIERICELEPSFFLIENVKGLISTKAHRDFLDEELRKLEEKGYAVDLAVLNALEVGVPQDRERVFIVGVKRTFERKTYGVQIRKLARQLC